MSKGWRALVASGMTWLLLSCGGGANVADNGAGGVGTGGTGIVAGTVSGLGSVIVDGTRYDESQAALERRPDLVHASPLALADLHIGQYAYLELDAAGTPTRVRIESQLVGPVAATSGMGMGMDTGRFSVWGQQVVVNRDPSRGPVTLLAGYGSSADLRPGDPVQVYGVLQSGDAGGDVILATRIERLAAPGGLPARVTGTLQQGGSGTLLLAGHALDASAATGAPALAAGSVVTAVVPWTASLPSTWQASAVSLLAPSAASTLRVGGAVHLLANGHALVQGVDVDLSTLSSTARAQVREGSYLTVAGQPRDGDGSRMAASQVAALPQGGQPAQLRGSITAVTGSTSFVVRGQAVDASSAQFVGGTAAQLAVGMYVDVQGQAGASGIAATQVTLPGAPPASAVLEISGTVQGVNTGTRMATVQGRDGRMMQVTLPSSGALPTAGQAISVTGYWDGSQLQVRDYEQDGSGSGN
jgi:hypothetical protein